MITYDANYTHALLTLYAIETVIVAGAMAFFHWKDKRP